MIEADKQRLETYEKARTALAKFTQGMEGQPITAESMKDVHEILKVMAAGILKEIPLNKGKMRVKVGENDYALSIVKKEYPDATMQDLREANREAEGFGDGYKDAVKDMKEWRNARYLSVQGLA